MDVKLVKFHRPVTRQYQAGLPFDGVATVTLNELEVKVDVKLVVSMRKTAATKIDGVVQPFLECRLTFSNPCVVTHKDYKLIRAKVIAELANSPDSDLKDFMIGVFRAT